MPPFHVVIPDRCAAASPESITTVAAELVTAVVMASGLLAPLGPGNDEMKV
jgi:hypothetical protein